MPPVKGKIISFRHPKSHREPEPVLFPRIQADSGSSEQLDDSNLRDNVAKFLDSGVREWLQCGVETFALRHEAMRLFVRVVLKVRS